MPTTAASLVVLVVGVFPGLLGDRIFRSIVGIDWREPEWRAILRILGFSVIGLALYTILAKVVGLPAPLHAFPSTYEAIQPNVNSAAEIAFPFFGHLVGGAISGSLGAIGANLLARFYSTSAYPSAWDDFVRTYTPDHWVVVSLDNGEVYAGKLKNADVAVAGGDRDLVLEEPALYNATTMKYVSSAYQYMFIRAETLYSISAVYEPALDTRVARVGDPLFSLGVES